jgi:hypothetical protein
VHRRLVARCNFQMIYEVAASVIFLLVVASFVELFADAMRSLFGWSW